MNSESQSDRPPLGREEVVKAVEHGGPARVPMMIHFWNGAKRFEDRAEQVEQLREAYPDDFSVVHARMPAMWDDPSADGYIPGYSWMHCPPPPPDGKARGLDAATAIADWSVLDDMLAAWPDPNAPQLFRQTRQEVRQQGDGRYTAGVFAFCLYERLWSLRGMENILCDFHTDPEPVHRLMDALCDFYEPVIRRLGDEIGADAFLTTDDVGMQTGPMFSPKIFREFFKPRYARLIDAAHESGMHFWLHTCGDVTPFMEDFIEIGLDVIHPIQKYAMDEGEAARRFGGRIAFWAGMDVQQILPKGTPEDVRREVRFMIDTYDRPDGGCMITAGNGITPDVSIENLHAFYDEAYNYGIAHRRPFD